MSPGEAVAFTIVESASGALSRRKKVLAEITGIGIADEPAPFLSDAPSKGKGLTDACKQAIAESACNPQEISSIISDLNGEFFPMKEWGYAESRCFHATDNARELWHPADRYGSVGSASGTVLINIAAIGLRHGWLNDKCLVFCSDDEPECGAIVIQTSMPEPSISEHGNYSEAKKEEQGQR